MINRMIKDENMNPIKLGGWQIFIMILITYNIHISTTELKTLEKIITNGNGKVEIKGKDERRH